LLGHISSSSQDIVYVSVRPETGHYLETINGGTESNKQINGTFGQQFSAGSWFTRIVVKIRSGGDHDLILRLFDTPHKNKIYHEAVFRDIGQDRVLHLVFEPLEPGEYYWEIDTNNQAIQPYIQTESTFGGVWENGEPVLDHSFKSKVMYCTNEPVLRAVAVDGDPVDNGAAHINSTTELGAVNTGIVEKNICRNNDPTSTGGRVLTGSWYLEL